MRSEPVEATSPSADFRPSCKEVSMVRCVHDVRRPSKSPCSCMTYWDAMNPLWPSGTIFFLVKLLSIQDDGCVYSLQSYCEMLQKATLGSRKLPCV